MDQSSIYAYDVGFSFSGEVRTIVEFINNELKSEDVITFYDFDSQAFLLAENLGSTLRSVYSESCKYYLVFLEESYLGKVWTNYERDIMTAGPRSKHIIPVFLESPSALKAVGIPSTTGMINLSDIWRQIKNERRISDSARTAIRNRLVLPLLEKIDTVFQEV